MKSVPENPQRSVIFYHGLHPSEYKIIYVTATTGSILELYRLILGELGMKLAGVSRAAMSAQIKREVLDLVSEKKMKAVLVVDEASLLRLEVFTELHTLCQFEMDSKPYLPLLLAGQSNLIDKLMYPGSKPLASRVVAKSHLIGADRDQMKAYILHHLTIAGVKTMLFDDTAVTAIHQGSGGIYRKANHLARGGIDRCRHGKSKNGQCRACSDCGIGNFLTQENLNFELPVKRSRALLGSNPTRDSRLRWHHARRGRSSSMASLFFCRFPV